MTVTVVQPAGVPSRVGIVVSAFNEPITRPMADAATTVLERAGVSEIIVAEVPGALEIVVVAKALIEQGCEGIVAIGAVIEGETDHYTMVARAATDGIAALAATTGIPVGNAVLTVREYDHAVERSRPGPGNKGAEAADAVLAAAGLLKGVERLSTGAGPGNG